MTTDLIMRVNVRTTTTTTGGPVSIQAVSFPGDTPGRVFFKFDMTWGKSEKVYYGGCGARTRDPKNPWSVDDAIC